MEYPRDQYLAQSYLTFLSMTFLKLIHLPEITTSTTIYADDVHLLFSGSPNNLNKRTETFQITIDDTLRHMEDKVKNLGVIFDSRLSFEHHIK